MRRISILVSMLVALFALAGCGENQSWRQKTILEVETPNGIVTGGSVVEVSVRWFSEMETSLNQGHSLDSESRGEASFVEVAPGKYLFALSVYEPVSRTFVTMRSDDDSKYGQEINRMIGRRLESSLEVRSVSPGAYPVLVTFEDINDPQTAKIVDPFDLAATFGEGFKLKDIKLEITGEEVTVGEVEKVVKWIHSPTYLKNPLWAKLPSLTQETILGLVRPVGVK